MLQITPVYRFILMIPVLVLLSVSCIGKGSNKAPGFNEPLITGIYTADPSARVFGDRLYIYPSHDIDSGITPDNDGNQYDMKDYHVFSLKEIPGRVTDHGEVLSLQAVPWASHQLWAPDAALIGDKYILYFPARDKEGLFRIGTAVSDKPEGPFTAQTSYIPGSFSMDPCAFVDDDGSAYLYFGGLWGGQLEKWQTGSFDPAGVEPDAGEPALGPRVARLTPDGLGFAVGPMEVTLLDGEGNPVKAGDHLKRFFEGAWMHKKDGMYYLSWSTGDTHRIVYATGNNPLGPFTYRGVVLLPVTGWTTHHSIVEFKGKWFLFYHDATLSGGVDHLRNIKVSELAYNEDGTIVRINPYPEE
jgi:hypothetical protein